ncbi:MAG: PaaI family thioesterase [Micromonosporaceae bacterium]
MTTADDDAEAYLTMANTGIQFTIPVAHRMGVTFVELRPGHVVAEVPVDGNTNHVGTMYAGVLFTVGEILGGGISIASFDNSAYYPIVKELKIRFRRPARTTVRATASLDEQTIAETLKRAEADGKADFTLDAELVDEEGTVVATTHGTYQLRAFAAG